MKGITRNSSFSKKILKRIISQSTLIIASNWSPVNDNANVRDILFDMVPFVGMCQLYIYF